ncbi:MAG: AraC family transcriptional regulator [Magnetospirillum sp.]|nr:AraC family transcriptional regulator [Magnetospirillum sp.]
MKRGKKKTQSPRQTGDDGFDAPRSYDWNALRCRLLWCYRNKPTTISGSFETMNFILWYLLEGEVEVTAASGPPLTAKKGEWMVLVPGLGRRGQTFAPNSKIISIHFSVEVGSAKWTGPSAAVLGSNAELMAAAEGLEAFTYRKNSRGVAPGGPILPIASLDEQIEVQLHIWSFWKTLARLLSGAGIRLRAPDLTHPVMAKSMALIESWPMAANWNRREVSQVAGVSASQLDRIWRETCGQTPFQYWSQRRLLYACSQLQQMERGVKEIAYDLGFAHLSQFSNWFRRFQHTSPRTYRSMFSG